MAKSTFTETEQEMQREITRLRNVVKDLQKENVNLISSSESFQVLFVAPHRELIVRFRVRDGKSDMRGYTTTTINKNYNSLIYVSNKEFDRHLEMVKAIDPKFLEDIINEGEMMKKLINTLNNDEVRVCKKCNTIVELETELDYPYYCNECDEYMFEYETEIISNKKK